LERRVNFGMNAPRTGQGGVIRLGLITYQCYQTVSASKLITITDHSGPVRPGRKVDLPRQFSVDPSEAALEGGFT